MSWQQNERNLRPHTRIPLWIGALVLALLAVGAISVSVYAGGLPGHWTTAAQKQAALAQAATQQAQASSGHHNTNKQPNAIPTAPASCPQPTVAPGVSTVAIGGEAFTQMYVQNTASAYHNNQASPHYIIAGGALNANRQQGVIGVERIPTDLCVPNQPAYELSYHNTPYQGGAVTLTNLQGDVILFTTADGHSGSFNFVTGQYL
jgi:hypothetical protein